MQKLVHDEAHLADVLWAVVDKGVSLAVTDLEHSDNYREMLRRNIPVERYFRDAPLMTVAAGKNEIQRHAIVRQLIERGPR